MVCRKEKINIKPLYRTCSMMKHIFIYILTSHFRYGERKPLYIIFCLLFLSTSVLWGQSPHVAGTPDDSRPTYREPFLNIGIKGGFTASLLLVSNLTLNGVRIEKVQNNYKIGHFGSLFMRMNFGHHFLQPELSYAINRCNITFGKSDPEKSTLRESAILSSIHSIDIPFLYGYNIVKEKPYSMALFAGPKLRYLWNKKSKVSFINFDQQNIEEKLRPLCLSLTIGASVTISRIFFDFRYDVGLHNISRSVTYTPVATTSSSEDKTGSADDIRFRRRENVLSFSLGIFF